MVYVHVPVKGTLLITCTHAHTCTKLMPGKAGGGIWNCWWAPGKFDGREGIMTGGWGIASTNTESTNTAIAVCRMTPLDWGLI